MNDDERKKLAQTLSAADDDTLQEIVREAELFLGAQLSAGLASDQRAMTLAAIIAAVLATLLGGTATVAAASIAVWPHVIVVVIVSISLIIALIFAVLAASPTTFSYAGNSPRLWSTDIGENRALKSSIAGQAALYAQGISQNSAVLSEAQKRVKLALKWAAFSVMAGFAAEFVILLISWGSHGSFLTPTK